MKYWVIKGSPRENNFEEILGSGKHDTWHTKKPSKHWASGDRLFFWESSPVMRLVGIGEIRDLPDRKDEQDRTLFDVIYLSSKLGSQPSLPELREFFNEEWPSFIKANVAGTVFSLTNSQGENLFCLLASRNEEIRRIWRDILVDNETESNFDIDESTYGIEGAENWISHIRRERDPSIIKKKKRHVWQMSGGLRCEACDLDFYEFYGEIGRDFCEVHHLKPLSEAAKNSKTFLSDLAILCSNCHRMIHRTRPIMGLEAFKRLISAKPR